jgi:hypothetical protein
VCAICGGRHFTKRRVRKNTYYGNVEYKKEAFQMKRKERNEKIVKIRKLYILLLYPVKDL